MKESVRVLVLTLLVAAMGALILPPAHAADEGSDNSQAENAFFRGSHLLSRDNMEEALPALEKAVKLDPGNPKYRNVLATAYNNQGLRLNREGNYKQGLLLLSKALDIASDEKDIRLNYSQSVLEAVSQPDEKLSPDEKARYLEQLLELEPDNPTAKRALAVILNNSAVQKGKSGDFTEEAARLEKASALDSANPKIKKNLAVAYFNLAGKKAKAGEFEEEIELLKASAAIAGKDSVVMEQLGRALSNFAVKKGKESDTAAQIELLKKSLEIFPGDPVTKSNLASAYNNLALADTALSFSDRVGYLETALKLDPKNKTAAANLSVQLVKEAVREAKTGAVEKAVELLEKAGKIDPANKSVPKNLAAVFHNDALRKGEEGKHELEIKLLQKALGYAPQSEEIKADLAVAFNDYALALGKKGDIKQELLYLGKAAKLVPDNKIIQENLNKAKMKNVKEEKKEPGPAKKKADRT